MSRRAWPLSFRQRALSIPVSILIFAGYRRWLSRPWQWSLRDYMIIVALCAVGLLLWGYPTPVIVFFMTLGAAVYTCVNLAKHGFKLPDILTLLAIILLTAAFALPALERTSSRTLGKRFLSFVVPEWYMSLFSGSE